MDWKQRALYQLMSDISEDCYCAGWMQGNEYTLWEMVADPSAKRNYGQGEVEQWQIDELKAISEEIGGWIRWLDDEDNKDMPVEDWGAVFVPMSEWLTIYKDRMAQWEALRAKFEKRDEAA